MMQGNNIKKNCANILRFKKCERNFNLNPIFFEGIKKKTPLISQGGHSSPTVQWSNPYQEVIHSPVKIFVPVINQKVK